MQKIRNFNKKNGFTLIELMIVIAIIALLTAIAVPSYNEYIRRSYRADAKNTLVAIAQRLEQNYTLTGSYAATQTAVPINDAYLTTPWGLGQTPPSGTARYNMTFINAAPSATTYTLVATPFSAQVGDTCGSLTLDYRNLRGVVINNVTYANRDADTLRCWAR